MTSTTPLWDDSTGVPILERTPGILRSMLEDLPEPLVRTPEPDGWSPFDVVGHLIHGEETDWIARARTIVTDGEDRPFAPFDRFAMFRDSEGRSIGDLLDRFETLRARNLEALGEILGERPAAATRGIHPELGPVTLGELLSTWVVHDLNHVAQISRVLASRWADEVGPWSVYLPIVTARVRP